MTVLLEDASLETGTEPDHATQYVLFQYVRWPAHGQLLHPISPLIVAIGFINTHVKLVGVC